MNTIDIAFVILNFNSFTELTDCISSIKINCNNCKWKIIIIDNDSQKEEKKELLKLSGEDNINIIFNNSNLGFAKGNNVGFEFVKKHYSCKYIAMINSDVLLTSDNFFDLLQKAYDDYNFAVLGPDILYSHDNPMNNPLNTKQSVKDEIKRMKKERQIIKTPIINYLYLLFKKIKFKNSKKNTNYSIEDCQLHGCFWVFSDLYTLKGLCEDTFLYGEEAILAKDCHDNDLKLLYYPEIKIIHKESLATKKLMPQRIKRKIFYYDNYINSLYILLKKFK